MEEDSFSDEPFGHEQFDLTGFDLGDDVFMSASQAGIVFNQELSKCTLCGLIYAGAYCPQCDTAGYGEDYQI